MIKTIGVQTHNQQLVEITREAQNLLDSASSDSGLLTLFIRHTSASLIVQENADPSVQHDLLNWMNHLVPENQSLFTHTSEGPDDMPAHIKAMLTQSSIAVPFENRRLMLGTWQGLFLFEHRRGRHPRQIIAHF
ncbi:MAG: YjbQ family protein [Proteobacteria bacterium]|nr:YjbQ family protein [Pseudomonadota bacterium]